jgi:hypothetical protein
VRPEIRAADERWELLEAARAWRDGGAIDDAELAAIRARHPDDRRRSRPGFRLLFFLFTLFAGQAAWAFVMTLFGFSLFGRHEIVFAGAFALLAALAAVAAEWATAVHRLRGFGVEEGLVALALGGALAAIVLLLSALHLRDWPALVVGAGSFAALAVAALWRWAMPLTGALAAAALFAALYGVPGARALWIVAGCGLAVAAWHGAAGERLGPAHRRRCDEIFVVATLALYGAVHVAGMASDRFGWWTRTSGLTREVPGLGRLAAWLAMTAVPAALLAVGLRRRDRLALALGALLALATLASGADALDLGPGWLVLLAGGTALAGAALLLRRVFAGRPGRTAAGFTDRPLFEPDGGRSFLEIAAVLATLSPAPRPPAPPAGFEGRGGDFGGGGASGKF